MEYFFKSKKDLCIDTTRYLGTDYRDLELEKFHFERYDFETSFILLECVESSSEGPGIFPMFQSFAVTLRNWVFVASTVKNMQRKSILSHLEITRTAREECTEVLTKRSFRKTRSRRGASVE